MHPVASHEEHGTRHAAEEVHRVLGDRREYRGHIARRAGDHTEDLARGGLLFPGPRLTLQRLRLIPKSLRQALFEVADPGVLVPWRLAGNGRLGFLELGRLWTPAHQPLLASYESAEDRLGERTLVGK